jgi:hypothetical protein
MTQKYKIGILCPTRKRVDRLKVFIESINANATYKNNCTFHFLVDSDDKDTIAFLTNLCGVYKGSEVKFQIHEPNSVALSDMWNKLYQTCDDDIVLITGDDAIMRTSAWDEIINHVFNQIPDKIGMVYGRDGIHDAKFAAQFFLHREWINAAGYIFPPYYTADWADTWVFDVATIIKRAFFIEHVFLEHMHWSIGKSEMDETVVLAQARRGTDNNEFKFHSLEHFSERLNLAKCLYEVIWKKVLEYNKKPI